MTNSKQEIAVEQSQMLVLAVELIAAGLCCDETDTSDNIFGWASVGEGLALLEAILTSMGVESYRKLAPTPEEASVQYDKDLSAREAFIKKYHD